MIGLFHRFLALLRKELSQLLKNPKTRITLMAPPIIQLFVLGYAATLDLNEIRFAVLDYAGSANSRELIARFRGSGIFKEQQPLESYQSMRDRIDHRDIRMALVIPADFERKLSNREHPQLQVVLDGRNSTTAGLSIGYAQSVVDNFNRDRYGDRPAVVMESRAWFNENYQTRYFMIPALLAMIALLDLMLLTALSIAREREDGTFDQLLMTPYSSAELLIGKGIATMIMGLMQLTFGLLMARLWFEIPFHSSYWLLYGMFLSFLYASVGIGLLISVHCNDLQQAMLGAFLVVIPFAMLSGLATPIDSMPMIFQKITLLNPIRYGIESLHRLFLEGVRFRDLLPTFLILWGIGFGTSLTAYFSFRRQRES